MENFLDSVLFIMELLLSPQVKLYNYFNSINPEAFDVILTYSSGLITFLTIIGLINYIISSSEIDLEMIGSHLGSNNNQKLFFGIIIYLFIVLFLQMVDLLSTLYLVYGYSISQIVLSSGAYRIGKWGRSNIGYFILSILTGFLFAFLLPHNILIIFSLFTLSISGFEAFRAIYLYTNFFEHSPLAVIGTVFLSILGSLQEPMIRNIYIDSSGQTDFFSGLAWYLFIFMLPLGLLLGLLDVSFE
jgi:hypothetical protein